MTEEELKRKKAEYAEMPSSELILKLIYLTGKMVVTLVVRTVLFVLKICARTLMFCMHLCCKGWKKLVVFWNQSDTQEKKKKIVNAIRKAGAKTVLYGKMAWAFTRKYSVIGARLAWKYICIGSRLLVKYMLVAAVAFWQGLLWTLHTIKDLIIHSKPTFVRLGRGIKQGFIGFGHWCVNVCRGVKLRHIRRKRAWQHFRRTKGFRGLLVDLSRAMSNGIKNYMNEDLTEADPESITEDEIFAERIEDRPQGKVDKIGKKFFEGMKDIVEEK